jgi:asparagine synthase (glutamine-hydrolysing)
LNHKDILSLLPNVLNSLDEPFGDSSVLPIYFVSKATRDYVTVALSGDDADELFAGYNKYLGEYWIQYYLLIPDLIRKELMNPSINMVPDSKKNKMFEYMRKIKKFVNGASQSQENRHFSWMERYTVEEKKDLLTLLYGTT